MQLVIAAMTTAPWRTCAIDSRQLDRHTRQGGVVAIRAREAIGMRSAENVDLTSSSSMRSCGGGPATLGTIVPRSSSSTALKTGSGVSSVAEHTLLLVIALDEVDLVCRAAGHAQVAQRFVVDREEAHRRAVFGRHVGDRRPVGKWQSRSRARRTPRTGRPRRNCAASR